MTFLYKYVSLNNTYHYIYHNIYNNKYTIPITVDKEQKKKLYICHDKYVL